MGFGVHVLVTYASSECLDEPAECAVPSEPLLIALKLIHDVDEISAER